MQGSSNSAAGVREGDILAGQYRVERVLGIGGMGVVVAAHHIQLDEKVALKFLLPEALGNAEAVARFAREARAAVKIKSEHVARVMNVGTLPNGAPYMVMEYLDGRDLDAWLRERGPLPIGQAIEFILQACEALAEAHALGIVHRDLKPANLFCVRRSDGRLSIKVLDFGISKMSQFGGSVAGAKTHASALMGSPLYMSPEQMRSARDVNSQTDIWAIGIVLFELFTGKTPFMGESLPEVFHRVGSEPPPPLRELRPEVSVGLERVILRCLEKNREQRFSSVAELALALLPFAPQGAKASVERISGIIQAAGLSANALAVGASPHASGTRVSSGTLQPMGRTTVGARRGRSIAIGAGVFGALAVVVGVTFALFGRFGSKLSTSRAATSTPAVASEPQAVDSRSSAAAVEVQPVGSPIPAEVAAPHGGAAPPTEATTATLPSSEPPKTKKSLRLPPGGTAMGATPALSPVAQPAKAPATAPTATPPKSAGPNCSVVTDYDSEGQPHFRKVCK
jgi:serine/threonine-protein kinase